MHTRVGLLQIRQLGSVRRSRRNGARGNVRAREVRVTRDDRIREFAKTDRDTAGDRSSVREHTVVRDFEIVVPAVHEDAATALRAVGDGETVDTRRVAEEIAREITAISSVVL